MKKRLPEEWMNLMGVEIVDPDGWRQTKTSWDTPITAETFIGMMNESTICPMPNDDWAEMGREIGPASVAILKFLVQVNKFPFILKEFPEVTNHLSEIKKQLDKAIT